MAIRWSDNDKYWGPFTYSNNSRYKTFTVELDSGDNGDYPGCRIRLSIFGHTLITQIPAIIKPYKQKCFFTTPSIVEQRQEEGKPLYYYDYHRKVYGLSFLNTSLHIHYGAQTHSSETDKVKVFFYPWKNFKQVRQSFYDDNGELFYSILDDDDSRAKLGFDRRYNRNRYQAEQAIQDACPTLTFLFKDYDGEVIEAKTRIEEREWARGTGLFKWMQLFCKPKISRYLELHFSAEVGPRKGSWKGGTIGHSIELITRDETHENAFKRYCLENNMEFIGEKE